MQSLADLDNQRETSKFAPNVESPRGLLPTRSWESHMAGKSRTRPYADDAGPQQDGQLTLELDRNILGWRSF